MQNCVIHLFTDAINKRNIRLTRISIIIVVVFIICHFPRMILNIAELVGVNTSKFDIFTVILSINHILLTINASVNYIIYLLLCGRGQQNSTGNYSNPSGTMYFVNNSIIIAEQIRRL